MRYLLTIITFLLTTIVYSQYPIITVDSLNNKVVIFTLEQAKKIDTQLEVLRLMELSQEQYYDIDSLCIQVINDKDEVIYKLDESVILLNERIEKKEVEIKLLKEHILKEQMINSSYEETIKLKDYEIDLHKDKIKSQRNRMIIGGSIGGVAIIGLILAILLK